MVERTAPTVLALKHTVELLVLIVVLAPEMSVALKTAACVTPGTGSTQAAELGPVGVVGVVGVVGSVPPPTVTPSGTLTPPPPPQAASRLARASAPRGAR